MSVIGNTPGVSSQRTVLEEVITGSPKSAFVPQAGYIAGYVDVLVNGLEIDTNDFTATDGLTINLVTPAAVGDTVKVKAWLPRGLSDGYLKTEADARFLSSTAGSVLPAKMANNGAEFGMRNRLINGNGMFQQRANLAIAGVANGYANDRWIAGLATGTSVAAVAFGSVFAGSSSGKGIYVGGTYTNGTPYFAQRIESINTQDLNGQNVTVSGLMYQDSGSTQTMLLRLVKPSATDNYTSAAVISTKTVSVPSGAVTPFAVVFTLGSADATNGLQLDIQSSSLVTVTSKNFGISDMQLEKGSVATPFEFRHYSTELALCQRYFELMDFSDLVNAAIGNSYQWSGTNDQWCSVQYKVLKRTTPSATSAGTVVLYGAGATTTATPTQQYIGQNGLCLRIQPASFSASGAFVGNSSGFKLSVSAEL